MKELTDVRQSSIGERDTIDHATAKRLLGEILELKAMIAQLGPVRVEPTVMQEIAACRSQGIDIASYFKAKGAAAARRKPTKSKAVDSKKGTR